MPLWRKDGKELYYRTRDNQIKAVAMSLGPTLQVGETITLFETLLDMSGNPERRYDISADGQRFVVNRLVTFGDRPSFILVQNWSSALDQR